MEYERPGKKRRKREMDIIWGNEEEMRLNEGIVEWLHDREDWRGVEDTEAKRKQTKLKPWTWQRIEARKVILEIVRRAEEESHERKKWDDIQKNLADFEGRDQVILTEEQAAHSRHEEQRPQVEIKEKIEEGNKKQEKLTKKEAMAKAAKYHSQNIKKMMARNKERAQEILRNKEQERKLKKIEEN